MSTTRVPILHENLLGGVETTLPPHLVSPDKWTVLHNMRAAPRLRQVPRKTFFNKSYGHGPICNLVHLAGSSIGTTRLVVFTDNAVLDFNGNVLAALNGPASGTQSRKYGMCVYNGDIYYTNELNTVNRCDGITNVPIENAPYARYIAAYYDHLFLAHVEGNSRKLQWCDLYNFANWDPASNNEADHYEFVEWDQLDHGDYGITGLGKLGGVLWVYTATSIIPIRYVGLPKVIQVVQEQIKTRIGNAYPWSLVMLDQQHFFYDGIEKNFFRFDGDIVEPIGEPVRRYLEENLSDDPVQAARMWAYVDTANREIWWVFPPINNPALRRAVVFNYRYKRWFTADTEYLQSFSGGFRRVRTAGELVGAAGSLFGVAGNLGNSGVDVPRIYGNEFGQLFRDLTEVEEANTPLQRPLENGPNMPVLETPDLIYGDLHTVKEVDAIYINGNWGRAGNPNMRLNVHVSARDYLDNPVVWDENTLVGVWDDTLPEGCLTFNAKAGRVLRYRFEGILAQGLKITAFADRVRRKTDENKGAEK